MSLASPLQTVLSQSGAVLTTTGLGPRGAIPAFTKPLLLVKNCLNCTVSGLTFDAAAGGASAVGMDAFALVTSTNCSCFQLEGIGFGHIAIFSEIACVGSSWENCHVHDSTNASRGFWLGHTQSSVEFGPYLTKDLKVHHCRAINNDATGIVVVADGASILGNTSSDNNGSGIISPALDGYAVRNHVIVGNICEGNAFYGYQTDVYANDPTYYPTGLTLTSNIFNGNTSGGILLNKCRNSTASANVCSRNGTGGSAYGIQVEGTSSGILISSNTCFDDRSPPYQSAGIAIYSRTGASLSQISVVGNACAGNVRGIDVQTISGTASLSSLNISGNVTRFNNAGIFLAHGGQTFEDVVVNGNNCRSNSVTDLRCTVGRAKLRANTYSTHLFSAGVPYQAYASDSDAGTGGLKRGEEYQTITGELRAKL